MDAAIKCLYSSQTRPLNFIVCTEDNIRTDLREIWTRCGLLWTK